MKKILQILKNHKWAILFALIATAIIVSPQIYFRYHYQDTYQGIEIIGDSPWAPRVQEARDGHFNFGSIYYKDGKDNPYLFQPLGSIMVASLGKMFSLNLNDTFLLFRLIFPFLIFLIIYGFVLSFSKNKLAALTSATVILLAETLLSRSAIFLMLSGETPRNFLYLIRAVNPALTLFFFFGFLLLFWLFLEKKQWRWGIISTLILGLTFYDYFYTWTFLYAFAGVLFLIFLFKKRWEDVKRILIVFVGGAILAIPYFLNLYRATTHPNYQEIGEIFGLIQGRVPVFGFSVPFVFIIFLLFFPRKQRDRYFFALALVVAPFIALNQQIITGRLLQVGHYHWFFNTPLAIIILLFIFFYWVSAKKWEFIKKISAISIMVMSIYAGIFIQAVSYANIEEEAIEKQKYGPVIDWLNENSEKEEIVFANNEISHLVVVYTSLNVFNHHAAMYSLSATRSRLLETLFSYYRLDGVGENDAQSLFLQERGKISGKIYGMYYRELLGDYEAMPDEVIQEIIQKYQESLFVSTNEFLNQVWSKYEVKYLVWDKQENPQWQLDQYQFLEKSFEAGNLIVYEKN